MRILRKTHGIIRGMAYALRMADKSRLRPRRTRELGDRVNLYIADADRDVWEKAERFARERGVSLSSVVADALARYMTSPPKSGD